MLRLGRFLPSYIQEVPIQKSSSLISIFLFFGLRRRLSGLSARQAVRKENRETKKKGGLFSDVERHFVRVTIEDILARYDSEDRKTEEERKK